MQSAGDLLDPKGDGAAVRPSIAVPASAKPSWDCVARGKPIFQPGQPRRLYRIESGAVCHLSEGAGGQSEVIECAFPGDIIGLGYLATHSSSASAMIDTMVSIVTAEEFEQALRVDDQLAFKLADAGEREFDYVRNKTLPAALLPPLQRVANYLLVLASINGGEGRDGSPIVDDVTSGYVARQLNMTIDTLAMAMLNLRRSGLLDVSQRGLHIVDVAGLEAVAASSFPR